MAYCTVDEISSEFKNIDFTASNAAISSAEVASFITQEERAIESRIAGVYEIPVTGSHSTSVVKLMNILMVKSRVQDILYIKTGQEKTDQGNTAVELRERVDAMIKDITERRLILTDATLANSAVGASSYNGSNSITPTFEKGSTQW